VEKDLYLYNECGHSLCAFSWGAAGAAGGIVAAEGGAALATLATVGVNAPLIPAEVGLGAVVGGIGGFLAGGAKDIYDFISNATPPDNATHPSTPIGQRGSPLDVAPGTNDPANIGGRDYTGHALDRMQGRGVPPSAVGDAIQNGSTSPGNQPGTTVHTGNNGVTVVTGQGGRVVTVY
jgi:hypothetical protein